jgi:hypothetical protein
MKRICILLNGSIKNDARVIRIIRTFSDAGSLVDLYYVNGESADRQLFDEKVSLFSFPFGESLKNKVLRHSFFFLGV